VTIYSKINGEYNTAVNYLQKEIDIDTSKVNKAKYCKQAADILGKYKIFGEQIKWLEKAIQFKGGSMGEADFYNLAVTALAAKDFQSTLDIAIKYFSFYPDKPQGYSFQVKAAKAIDTASTLGLAVEPALQQNDFLTKQIEVLKKDTIANKKAIDLNSSIIYRNLCYLMTYYNDVQKDVPKAIEACDKIIALYNNSESEQNKFAVKIKGILEKSQTKVMGGKPATNSKPQK
jgi:tetratricopeptide (TPR) repeat protein